MAGNRVTKIRRCPPRRAKAKQIRYLEVNSDESIPPSPEPAAEDNTTPPAAEDNTTPSAAQNNNNKNSSTPPEDPSSDPGFSGTPEAPPGTPPTGWHDLPTNFPPEFWDSLSSAWLTKRGLRELDRRNEKLPRPVLQRPKRRPRSLAEWAMHGGPDTRHLRGYQDPEVRGLVRLRAKQALKRHVRADPLSAYDANLGQWLKDNSVYPVQKDPSGIDLPSNMPIIENQLKKPFQLVGPKVFTEAHFKRWKSQARKATGADVMDKVFRDIIGDTGGLRGRDVQFTNLAPLAGPGVPVIPAPTAFDASPAASVHGEALDQIGGLILPVEGGEFAAPNFFLEASWEGGRAREVEERRACYHGALGARAMLAMQNFGGAAGPPQLYERAAHAFSATFTWEDGLSLHAHHVAPPRGAWRRPEYHMTRVGSWDLKKGRKTFADGVSAFRNLVEMAGEFREHMVEVVNRVAETTSGESSEGVSGETSES